jgi:hypothetical protein
MQRTAGMKGMEVGDPIAIGTLQEYVRGSLIVPPQSFDYAKKVKNFPLALNDVLNNCTIASAIHLLQLAYAEVSEIFEYPGDDVVAETYRNLAVDGNGLVERIVLDHWMRQGLFNTKIIAYAPVDIKNRKEMTAAIYAFGGLLLGVHMTEETERQFTTGNAISLTGKEQGIIGGHAMVATGASPSGMGVVTWGHKEHMTWDWWDKYAHEAWAIIPEVFVEADHGPIWNVDILGLRHDLENL